ncbi:MAG: hypothetical protein AAGN66_01350 [Acidobacteriota bacterium]
MATLKDRSAALGFGTPRRGSRRGALLLSMLWVLGTFLAGAAGAADSPTEMDMDERCRREVEGLHAFFQEWFNAEVDETDRVFERFSGVMGDGFVLVSPDGSVAERAPLTAGLRRAYGRWRGNPGKIWIENYRFHRSGEGWAMVTYDEAQEVDGELKVRRSSALFGADPEAPNGVVWWHLHEVWLPAADPR